MIAILSKFTENNFGCFSLAPTDLGLKGTDGLYYKFGSSRKSQPDAVACCEVLLPEGSWRLVVIKTQDVYDAVNAARGQLGEYFFCFLVPFVYNLHLEL